LYQGMIHFFTMNKCYAEELKGTLFIQNSRHGLFRRHWHNCLNELPMVSNREISRQLNLYAQLLLLHGKDTRLAHLLSGAAYRIRHLDQEVLSMPPKALSASFKAEVIKVLRAFSKADMPEALNELIQLTPSGLFEMMRIKGLGGKKLHDLWHMAKIDNMEALLEACKEHKLSLPGFGIKTQQNIVAAIEALHESRTHFHYASVADVAVDLVVSLRAIFKTALLDLCGATRRQSLTVECIEMVTAIPVDQFTAKAVKRLLIIGEQKASKTKAHTIDEVPVVIYHTTKEKYALELFTRTGNNEHIKKVLSNIKGSAKLLSENAIYKKAGLPFIVPEMREDVAEWNYKGKEEDLIVWEDIKGVVHNHTDWSDGVDSLASLRVPARKKDLNTA